MVTYIMDHPVYVPRPRLLSTSFHTFVVINWLINYPQADNNRDTGRFRRNPHAPVLVSCDSVFPSRLGVFDIIILPKYTFMFLLQTKLPNIPSSDVSWEWKHGKVLQIIYANFHSWSVHTTHLWCHVISVINEMNTHYTSAIWPCFSNVLILVDGIRPALFFHFMHISCIGQYVYIHNNITSTDQAIKATQFAVNRGCILTRVAAIEGLNVTQARMPWYCH